MTTDSSNQDSVFYILKEVVGSAYPAALRVDVGGGQGALLAEVLRTLA